MIQTFRYFLYLRSRLRSGKLEECLDEFFEREFHKDDICLALLNYLISEEFPNIEKEYNSLFATKLIISLMDEYKKLMKLEIGTRVKYRKYDIVLFSDSPVVDCHNERLHLKEALEVAIEYLYGI